MEEIRIEALRPAFEPEKLLLKLPPGTHAARVADLARMAASIADARGYAFFARVHPLAGATVGVGDAVFESDLLKEKIGSLGRVFPYICTEGAAMAAWGNEFTDPCDKAIIHLLRQTAVKACEKEIEERLCRGYGIPVLSTMNPGSLAAWPLAEQRKLFALFGLETERLGMRLLPTLLLSPDYSVSGIFFESGAKFYNCQLCPRKGCPNRKAPQNG